MKIEFYHTFNVNGKTYEGQWDLNPIAPIIMENVKVQDKKVLDLACRDGWYGFLFEQMEAKSVTQMDIDDRTARRFISKELGSKNVYVHENGYSLHKRDAMSFDVTFAGDILCHLQDPIRFLRNIHHVTKEKFFLVADTWKEFKLWYEGYPWMFREQDIPMLCRFAGFLNVKKLADFTIDSKYWSSRGSMGKRYVSLFEMDRNPAWKFGAEEDIVPYNPEKIDLEPLAHEVDFKE